MGAKLPHGNLKLESLGFLLTQNNIIEVRVDVALVCRVSAVMFRVGCRF